MVLYHLMTGMWPFDDLGQAELADATIQGERPDFNFCGYTLIPSLPGVQTLMEECWQDQPKARPGWKEIIQILGDVSSLCFRQAIPLHKTDSNHENAVLAMFADSCGYDNVSSLFTVSSS